jgi:hypothetical protein
MQPQRRQRAGDTENGDWLSRAIQKKLASGNKPDYEAAQRHLAEFYRGVGELDLAPMSDEEIDAICGRDLTGWPLVRIDEQQPC